jgi:hypothetical protein
VGFFDCLITRPESPIECGVSECDREAPKTRKPWPTRVYRVMKEIIPPMSHHAPITDAIKLNGGQRH